MTTPQPHSPLRCSLRVIAAAAAALVLTPHTDLHAAETWDVATAVAGATEASFSLNEGTWMSVDVSGDGKMLAFDLLGDVYTLPVTGGVARLVAGGPAMQRTPSFSRDGRKLLYSSDASGADNAWLVNLDGSDARQLTHETVDMLGAPTWGPKDESVVAVRVETPFSRRNAPDIRLYDLAGGKGQHLVASGPGGRDVQEPQVSPDGRYLFYTQRVTSPGFVYVDANQPNYVVRRREIATGEDEVLIGGFGGATAPQISPDGRRVAFVRRVMAKTVLFTYDLSSGEQRAVYDDLDRDLEASYGQQSAYYPHFAWFPDGKDVAIWGKGKLYRIDTRSGAAAEIPFVAQSTHRLPQAIRVAQDLDPETVVVRTIRQLALTRTGDGIVFSAVGRLWRKSGADAAPVRLTTSTAQEFEPAWSPDGRRVAYIEWDDAAGSSLKVVASSGGRARDVTTSPGLIREPAFSPDGRSLAYRISPGDRALGGFRAKAGVYLVATSGGEARFLAAGGETPSFSPDGSRVYFVATQTQEGKIRRLLKSVRLDGQDVREHAHTPDVDTRDLRISPDHRWIAFRDRQQLYVARYRETGSSALIAARSDAVPVWRLTDIGGHAVAWSADSSRLAWTQGDELYRTDVAGLSVGQPSVARSYAKLGLTLPTDRPTGLTAFVGARLITMRGDEVIERGTVVVQGNRIVAVGPSDAVKPPAGARIVDVTGKTITPGFVDMHGHNECCFGVGATPEKQPSRYAALAFGVTTNFDPYSTETLAYESEEARRAGLIVSPRWIPSGGVAYGRPEMVDGTYTPIDTYADAQATVRRKQVEGGTFIKSYRQPTRRQRQMLLKAGREAGVMIDGEGEGQFYTMISMLLDGHTNIEHNLPVANFYDDVVQLMKHGTTSNTPTLVVLFGEMFGENFFYQSEQAWKDPKIRRYVQALPSSAYSPLPVAPGAPPYARGMAPIKAASEVWDIGFRSVSRSVKALDDAGVVINAGSHGQIPGLTLHWEMWLLAEGGMSNLRVLRTGTLNGARTLGLEGQLGSLEPGKLADLVVLDGDPLENIRNSATARFTMVNGRLYDALTLDEVGGRPRGKFWWERDGGTGVDWNESWAGK